MNAMLLHGPREIALQLPIPVASTVPSPHEVHALHFQRNRCVRSCIAAPEGAHLTSYLHHHVATTADVLGLHFDGDKPRRHRSQVGLNRCSARDGSLTNPVQDRVIEVTGRNFARVLGPQSLTPLRSDPLDGRAIQGFPIGG